MKRNHYTFTLLDFKSDKCINSIPSLETITMVLKSLTIVHLPRRHHSWQRLKGVLCKMNRHWNLCPSLMQGIIGQRKVSLTGSCHHLIPTWIISTFNEQFDCFVILPHSEVQLQSTEPSEVKFSSKFLICLLYAWNFFKSLWTRITFRDRYNDCLRFTYEKFRAQTVQ